jgi:hypothetical protein
LYICSSYEIDDIDDDDDDDDDGYNFVVHLLSEKSYG